MLVRAPGSLHAGPLQPGDAAVVAPVGPPTRGSLCGEPRPGDAVRDGGNDRATRRERLMATRKTPAERLAEAETAKMIAEFDILAERAAAAGMPAKQVRAIRCALDLFGLLDWGDEDIGLTHDRISERIDDEEASIQRGRESMGEVVERRAAAKEGASQ